MVFIVTGTMVAGNSHVITDEYIDVEPDGYWNAEVAAGEHQRWSFDITEPRDHNIRIEINDPPGASLSVWMNGEELETVSGVGLFTRSLEAGPHALTIDNSGDVSVKYELYMGGTSFKISKSDSPDPVFAGNQLIYTITVSNPFNKGVAAQTVVDTLPAGVTFAFTSGCINDPSGVPACNLGPIPPRSSASYTITVDVDLSTLGIITNKANFRSANTSEDTTVLRRSVGGGDQLR